MVLAEHQGDEVSGKPLNLNYDSEGKKRQTPLTYSLTWRYPTGTCEECKKSIADGRLTLVCLEPPQIRVSPDFGCIHWEGK